MLMQTLIVAALVIGCAAYASWTLMPSGLRRRLAQHLLQMPWPSAVAQRLRRHAQAAGGCGCDGCDHATKRPTQHRRSRSAAPPHRPISLVASASARRPSNDRRAPSATESGSSRRRGQVPNRDRAERAQALDHLLTRISGADAPPSGRPVACLEQLACRCRAHHHVGVGCRAAARHRAGVAVRAGRVPTTITTSTPGASTLTASCRFCVA